MADAIDTALQRHHRLVQALCRAGGWSDADGPVEVVQTHLSTVLLSRTWALKLKKPLALDFVDFSTLERRRHFCEEELRLNRRTASAWYVDVQPVTGTVDAPRLGGDGEPIEWALRMRRFDSASAFDRLADAGALTRAHIDALATTVAAFHGALPASPAAYGDPQAALRVALDNLRTLVATLRADAATIDALHRWTRERFDTIAETLAWRRAQGRVREGHGDLHLANIAWLDGQAVPFDALEFDPRLRHVDVLADAVFAFMDLLDHGLPALAWRYLSQYLEHTGDHDGLPVVRWFAAYRALVRAKVAAIRAAQPDAAPAERTAAAAAAQRRLALAHDLAHPPAPRLVLTSGVSGSGKSTVAQRLVEALGAVRVRSDVERKRLYGLAATARVADPAALYHARATERTYARLEAVARHAVEGGVSVVVDAAFLRRGERDAMRTLARTLGVDCVTVECTAPEPVLRERLARRAADNRDASDATADVLALQLRVREPLAADEGAVVLDTDAPPDEVDARVDALVAGWRRG
ncbi:AAA family ATPase [Calidifontimicrobium sp. SYSU G02091]|uniref:bifunctional aminoglycoside phosphotransferase/ATP-binding protein n=1 Tax=Calidifontimicrobium sp. SYSU G02091 TaxID=2926421 RepID=UPI001F531CB2|nr:bifunctional aminoglycoside phosphotransferase/ATP-binding protein [Calidifontimicrobium sp. SYSU G02091]MCI1193790.1 AAA family ATPase [Calidifontimicrobium sp. SYSU G02091]